MAEINNPKAFPSKKFDKYESQRMGGTCYSNHESGMTLRDYFAAKAMQGFIANTLAMQAISDNFPNEGDEYVAQESYRMADAMLKQREQ